MTDRYVAYIRVSTARQGKSGLGLDAQRQRIMEYVGTSGEVIAWHEDHESGANLTALVALERHCPVV